MYFVNGMEVSGAVALYPYRNTTWDNRRPLKRISVNSHAHSEKLQRVPWKMRLEMATRNANRNPEWWGDCSQLVKIEIIEFLGISRYKVELRF